MNQCLLALALGCIAAPLTAQSQVLIVRSQGQGPAAASADQAHVVEGFRVLGVDQESVPGGEVIVVRQAPQERTVVNVLGGRLQATGLGVQGISVVRPKLQTLSVPGPRQGDPWIGLSLSSRSDGGARLEVDEVLPGTPAEAAKVEAGDKLVALDGRPISTHDSLLEIMRGRRAGERLQLTVEGTKRAQLVASSEDDDQGMLGVETSDRPKSKEEWRRGVRVDEVVSDSPAKAAGLRAGWRIAAVNGLEVKTHDELRTAVRALKPGTEVELRIQRDLKLKLAARPADGSGERSVMGMGNGAFTPVPEMPSLPHPPAEADGHWERHGADQEDAHQHKHVDGHGDGHGSADSGSSDGQAASPHFYWNTPPEPLGPQIRRQGIPLQERAGPRAPQGPAARGRFAPAPPPAVERARRDPRSGAGAELSAQLLEELRALRAEVADLRREIDKLRKQSR